LKTEHRIISTITVVCPARQINESPKTTVERTTVNAQTVAGWLATLLIYPFVVLFRAAVLCLKVFGLVIIGFLAAFFVSRMLSLAVVYISGEKGFSFAFL
jgi:hypothetical protein